MKSLWSSVLWGLLVLVIAAPTCGSNEKEELIESFTRLSLPEARSAILNYPLELQVDLYVASMMKNHPPDLGLTSVLASHGEQVVPHLLRRLTENKTDWDIEKTHLIAVFEDMQIFQIYDVASDETVMRILNQQIIAMKEPFLERQFPE